MNVIILKSPAKINLALDILGKDKSILARSYIFDRKRQAAPSRDFSPAPLVSQKNEKRQNMHLIQTILHEISLYDEVEITELDKNEIYIEWRPINHNLTNQKMGAKILINPNEFLLDEHAFLEPPSNIAAKAAEYIKKKHRIDRGVRIKIKKNIPLRSGLGGGSSNAAAVLKGLNQLWDLKLTPDKLREYGSHLGSDVPFFIEGGTAFATHFGEKIEILPSVEIPVALYHTGIEVESAKAYQKVRKYGQNKEKTRELLSRIKRKEGYENLIECMHNDFENFIREEFPHINDAHHALKKAGAFLTGLCGSGGMVFGVF